MTYAKSLICAITLSLSLLTPAISQAGGFGALSYSSLTDIYSSVVNTLTDLSEPIYQPVYHPVSHTNESLAAAGPGWTSAGGVLSVAGETIRGWVSSTICYFTSCSNGASVAAKAPATTVSNASSNTTPDSSTAAASITDQIPN